MNNTFNELKNKLTSKKCQVLSEDDLEKIGVISDLFQNEHCFFDLDMNTAINIISFLGVEDDLVLDYYYELISPKNYEKMPKIMVSVKKN